MKKEKTYTFKLVSNKIVSYTENSLGKLGYDLDILKNLQTKLEVKFGFNIDREIIGLFIKADFFYHAEEDKIDLINIETIHQFGIKDFKQNFGITKEKKVNIPDSLMCTFLGIAVSGTRGMLTASIKSPEYKNFIVPLVDIKKMMDSLKKNK